VGRKPKKTDIAAGIRGRPNPNTPSYEEVAREVLGGRADDYLERYAQFLLKGEGLEIGVGFRLPRGQPMNLTLAPQTATLCGPA